MVGKSRASRCLAVSATAWLLAACPLRTTKVSAANETEPLVRFVGRFDVSDTDRPRFAWPASAVATRFTGGTLHVHLKDTGYNELQVVIDGASAGVISTNPSREDYQVVTGLTGGPHELVLSKRTEARMGELTFLGFDPPAALVSPSHALDRRIEFIGDSITAGYGDLGAGATCTGNLVALENEYLAYGAVAARGVGAEHVTIAWAGRTTDEMNGLYDRSLPARPGSHWDFSKWVPAAVVINLGTNDFNRGDPGQAAFIRPYLALVRRVRTLYPGALIVCALGPMLTDSYPAGGHALSHARAYITEAVAELHATGDARVSFLEFPTQDFANGLGCDYHPSVKTHHLMGEQLAAVLRTQLQW